MTSAQVQKTRNTGVKSIILKIQRGTRCVLQSRTPYGIVTQLKTHLSGSFYFYCAILRGLFIYFPKQTRLGNLTLNTVSIWSLCQKSKSSRYILIVRLPICKLVSSSSFFFIKLYLHNILFNFESGQFSLMCPI